MTLLGHVRNGMIVTDDPMLLPDGTSVRIEKVYELTRSVEVEIVHGHERAMIHSIDSGFVCATVGVRLRLVIPRVWRRDRDLGTCS